MGGQRLARGETAESRVDAVSGEIERKWRLAIAFVMRSAYE